MKKWLTSENTITFGLMVGAVIVAMWIGPAVIAKAKSLFGKASA